MVAAKDKQIIFLCIGMFGLIVPVLCADGEFEKVQIEALSVPPELPDVMKPQDPATAHHNEAVAS